MKFQIGDPVYVKTNQEEGILEEFVGKDMASIRVEGVSYYVYLSDLEHPYLRWFTQKHQKVAKRSIYADQLIPEKNPEKLPQFKEGVYLLFMPVYRIEDFEDHVEKVKVYLYMEGLKAYKFQYEVFSRKASLFQMDSELRPGQLFYIHDIPFEILADHPVFTYHFVDPENPELDLEGEWGLKPKKLQSLLSELRFYNRASFHHQLFQKLKPREREEVRVYQASERVINKLSPGKIDFHQAIRQEAMVVDLHIEKLVAEPAALSQGEMLQLQLKSCQNALDMALATHQYCLILIHGIGRGVLKREISQLLNQTKGVSRYVNEFDIRYGYGATKVFFTETW